MKNFEDFVVENQEKPILIEQVKVEGIKYTNHAFIEKLTKPLLQAKTLKDAIVGSRNIANQLKRLEIAKDVKVSLDNCQDNLKVVFEMEEAPRLFAQTGVDFGSYDGSMNVNVKMRNVFGRGESFSAKSSYGIDTSTPTAKKARKSNTVQGSGMQGASANEVVFSKPLYGNPDIFLTGSLYQLERNHSAAMSFQERLRGFSLKVKSVLGAIGLSTYEFGYDAVWRENHSISADASLSVRNDAGHSLKSSISHQFNYDSRPDFVFPSSGMYANVFQELAGLGGDVSYLKSEVQLQKAFQLPLFTGLTTSFRSGLLYPLSNSSENIVGISNWGSRINDRFHLGGPTSLRGFEAFGLGPKDKRKNVTYLDDSLGGNTYYALGIDFRFPFPYLPKAHLQGHCFANAGSLISELPFSKGFHESIQSLAHPSVAAGLGLLVRFAGFRMELNYCVPIQIGVTDTAKPGFQFGIGMNFM